MLCKAYIRIANSLDSDQAAPAGEEQPDLRLCCLLAYVCSDTFYGMMHCSHTDPS